MEAAREEAAEMLAGRKTSDGEVRNDVGEQRRCRKRRGINTEPSQEQPGICNLEGRLRLLGDESHGNINGRVTSQYASEDEQQIGGNTGVGLEEGEIVMAALAQVNSSAQEKEHDHCTQPGMELGTELEGDTDNHSEEQRPSWEEEMANNKEV
ncbi:hypothetical protein AHAS_Ahas13G0431800 [Arachis hypogaea]